MDIPKGHHYFHHDGLIGAVRDQQLAIDGRGNRSLVIREACSSHVVFDFFIQKPVSFHHFVPSLG